MRLDSRLDILPKFQIRAISSGAETTLVTGTFTRTECVAIQDRGWLFVSETESSIADVVTLESDVAGLDVPSTVKRFPSPVPERESGSSAISECRSAECPRRGHLRQCVARYSLRSLFTREPLRLVSATAVS